MAGRFYALVVGIDEYPSSPLRGCVNDALAMVDVIEHRIGSAGGLVLETLLDGEATRQAVIDGFRQHLRQAGPEDQALFFYAGHGAQQKTSPELAHLEPLDGLDETLVLVDSRQSGSWDLADKELAVLLAELRARHVVVLLDSCNSGDATRFPEEERVVVRATERDLRSRPLESFLFHGSEHQVWEAVEGGSLWKPPERELHVALSACRSFELAREKKIGGTIRGLFSYHLVDVLSRIEVDSTYQEFLKQIQTRVRMANPNQYPHGEGDLRGRIFDGVVLPRPRVYHVRPVPEADGEWRLDAGAVHGMQLDARLAVFPEGTVSFHHLGTRLATVRVRRLEATSCELGLVRGEMPRAGGTLPAVLVEQPLPPLGVVCRGPSGLQSTLREMIQQSPVLEEGEGGTAWVEVWLEENRCRIGKPEIGDLVDPVPIEGPEDLVPVLDRLEHLARWLVVFHLRQSGGPLEEDIDFEIRRWIGPPPEVGDEPETEPWDSFGTAPESGARFTVRLQNRGFARVFIVLLGVSDDFSVYALRRAKGWLEPGRVVWLRKHDGIPATVPPSSYDRGVTRQEDLLLLIASEAEFDVSLIEHPELSQSSSRSPSDQRGPTSGAFEAFLRRLDGNFRKLDAEEEARSHPAWITRDRWIVSARPAPSLELEAGKVAERLGLRIRGPVGLRVTVRPHSAEAARSLPSPPPVLPERVTSWLRPCALAGLTLHDSGLTHLELRWRGPERLQEGQVLDVEGLLEPGPDEDFVPLVSDGRTLFWAGVPNPESRRRCLVAFLPEPAFGEEDPVWILFCALRRGESPEAVPGEPIPILFEEVDRMAEGRTRQRGFFGDLLSGLGDRWRASRLLEEGDRLFNSNRFAEARGPYEEALRVFESLDSRSGITTALGGLGKTLHALGDYAGSLEMHQRRLKLLRELTLTWRLQGQALSGIGVAYAAMGKYEKAIVAHEEHLELARFLSNPSEETQALGNLGQVYYLKGELDRAADLFEESLVLDEELGEYRFLHHTLNALGGVYLAQGKIRLSIEHFERSLQVASDAGDGRAQAGSYSNLADPHLYIGNLGKAKELTLRALEIHESQNDNHSLGQVLVKVGGVCFNLRQLEEAETYLARGRDHSERLRDLSTLSRALHYLGHINLWQGEVERALERYEESLELKRELGNRDQIAGALSNLALARDAQGQGDLAISLYQKAAKQAQSPNNQGVILNNLGGALLKAGQVEEAEETLRETLEIWEGLRGSLGESDADRITIYEQQFVVYGMLQRALVQQSRIEEALVVAERGRSRALVEWLGTQQAEEYGLEVDVTPPTIPEIRQIARRANATLVFFSTIYEETGFQQSKITQFFLWVVDSGGEIHFRRAPAISFAELAEHDPLGDSLQEGLHEALELRKLDADPDAGDIGEPLLRELYTLLIEPVEGYLPSPPAGSEARSADEVVVLIPDSHLLLVPFAAFLDGQGRPLIERFPLLMAPSIRGLDLMTRRRELISGESQGILAVGNPEMPRLPRKTGGMYRPAALPHAETEARNIAELFNTEAFLGPEASKERVLANLGGKRFIHLATHGLFEEDGSDMPGAVVLAGPTPEEALLTPVEILGLDLDAELVALSACETGFGRFTHEGIIGLFRSLLQAGAANVLVSLWAVADGSTAVLMTKFYRELSEGKTKAQALQTAILETRERYPHPRFWAPFVLIGEPT